MMCLSEPIPLGTARVRTPGSGMSNQKLRAIVGEQKPRPGRAFRVDGRPVGSQQDGKVEAVTALGRGQTRAM